MEEQTTLESNHKKWPLNLNHKSFLYSELKTQWRITVPLIAMNLTWFAKLAITTAFLGRLGQLPLAGATLGFTFANVTGFSVLNGLSCAMEPICGQAFGAKNFRLLHKTLVMAILLLLVTSIPIAFLWLNVDVILIRFGQRHDMAMVAKKYLIYLLPDLVITSFLCPLKAYLSTQNITVPIMISSALAVALHVPINVFLSRVKGVEGISMAVWMTDFVIVAMLGLYILIAERRKGGKWREGGWWEQRVGDWIGLIKLCGSCCLTTCLEWWCYEILVLLTGRLPNPARSVGALAIVLNFDYLIFSVILSLSTCASVRVSNELGAGRPKTAYRSAYFCLCISVVLGFLGGSTMFAMRGVWGLLYSRDEGIIGSVRRLMVLMAGIEVVNFPLAVCGGIVRGTARPWLGMYANICGFYLVALPLGVVLGFRKHMGLGGLLVGFLGGVVACLVLLLVFVVRINWGDEADKARVLTCAHEHNVVSEENQDHSNMKPLDHTIAL